MKQKAMSAFVWAKRYGIKKTLRKILQPKARRMDLYRAAVAGKRGLEIGGPSPFFAEFVPIYQHVAGLDNAVFSARTIWADNSGEFRFHPSKTPGRNLVLDGSALLGVSDGSYDFVLSCHSLEHIANPIKALKEWQRITRPGSALVIVLPHYRWTFDHRRPLTTVAHMMEDYERNVGEDDPTHVQEFFELHDLSRNAEHKSPEEFRTRTLNFTETRVVHHHTFDETNAPALLEAAGYRVKDLQVIEPMNLVMLATH